MNSRKDKEVVIYQWYVLVPKKSSGYTKVGAYVCIKHTVYVWNSEVKSCRSFHEERQWGQERVNWEPGVCESIKWGGRDHFRVLPKVGLFQDRGCISFHLNLTKRKLGKGAYFLFLFCTRDYYPSGHRTENITYTNNVKKHNKGIFFSSPLSGLMNLEEHWIKSQRPKFLVLLCP